MNSEKITQAEIEMMKGNKEAFCFWPEHLRAPVFVDRIKYAPPVVRKPALQFP